MEQISRFMLWLLLLIIAILVRGYVLSWLWLWFIVPIWQWAPLTISQAIAVSFVTNQFLGRTDIRNILKTNKEYSQLEQLAFLILANCVVLVLGYILHQFI